MAGVQPRLLQLQGHEGHACATECRQGWPYPHRQRGEGRAIRNWADAQHQGRLAISRLQAGEGGSPAKHSVSARQGRRPGGGGHPSRQGERRQAAARVFSRRYRLARRGTRSRQHGDPRLARKTQGVQGRLGGAHGLADRRAVPGKGRAADRGAIDLAERRPGAGQAHRRLGGGMVRPSAEKDLRQARRGGQGAQRRGVPDEAGRLDAGADRAGGRGQSQPGDRFRQLAGRSGGEKDERAGRDHQLGASRPQRQSGGRQHPASTAYPRDDTLRRRRGHVCVQGARGVRCAQSRVLQAQQRRLAAHCRRQGEDEAGGTRDRAGGCVDGQVHPLRWGKHHSGGSRSVSLLRRR